MMNMKTWSIVSSLFVILFSPAVLATDIADEVTDVEEITADSEAAKKLAAEAAMRVRAQKIENDRELKDARATRKAAELKRLEAAQSLQRSESDLNRLSNERAQIQKDVAKFNADSALSAQKVSEVRARVEALKQELVALRATKAEAQKRLQAAELSRVEVVRESGALADQKNLEQKDIERYLEEEKAALAELEKAKAEALSQKGQLEAKVAELKARYRQLREQRKSTASEIAKVRAASERLDEQARVGEAEIQRHAKPSAPTQN